MKQIIVMFSLLLAFSISLKAQDKIDSTQVYLRNAYILDFQTNGFRVGNILIKNDLISKIDYGKSSMDKVGILNHDVENKYLIPGLIDAHVHLGTDPSKDDNLEDTKDRLHYLILNGVTAVRDMAGDVRYLNYLSRLALLDEISSPDIYFSALLAGESFFKDPRTKLAAQGIEQGQAPWMRGINSSSDLNKIIATSKGTGATGVKIYADLDENNVKGIVIAAHNQNMKVWAHSTVFPARPSQVCLAGVDVMSHATYLAWEAENKIPTDASHRHDKHESFDINNPVFIKLMETLHSKHTILDATVTVYSNYSPDSTLYHYGVSLTKLAYQKKVKIGVGTDMPLTDLTAVAPIFNEMNALQNEVGMEPIDVIRAATIVNAAIIGEENRIGSIEVGKKANIVVLKSNPLINIENCSDTDFTIKNGKFYTRE